MEGLFCGPLEMYAVMAGFTGLADWSAPWWSGVASCLAGGFGPVVDFVSEKIDHFSAASVARANSLGQKAGEEINRPTNRRSRNGSG